MVSPPDISGITRRDDVLLPGGVQRYEWPVALIPTPLLQNTPPMAQRTWANVWLGERKGGESVGACDGRDWLAWQPSG
jgi:hypothetical protein